MPGYVQQDVLSQAELWLQQVPEIKPSYLHVIGIPEGEAFVRTDSKGNPLIAGTSLMRDGQLTLSTIVSAQPNTLTSARALIDVGNYIKENNIAFPPREEMSPDAIRIYDKLQGKVPEYAPTTAMAEWGTTTGKVIPVTPEVTGMEEIKVGLEILKRPLKVSPLKGKKLTPVRSITDKPGQTSMRVPLDEVVVTEPIPGGEKTFWYNEKRIILTPEQQQLVLKPEVTFPKAEAGMPKVTGGIVPPTSGLEAIDTSTAEGAAVAEVAGTPPSKPPTNWDKVGGDLYDSFMNRITRNPTPNTVPKTDRLKRARGKVERVISDEFARLNKLGWDAEVSVAMTKAARGRAGEMYRQVMNNVGRTLGWNSELIGHVNNYLILRHQLEVLKAIGGKHFTIISGGQTQQFTAKQLGLIFARMKKELGAVNYEKVKKAAPYVPALYNEILKSTDELTVAQIEGLHKKYPWYVPIIYADETTPINLLKGKKLNPRQIKRLTQWDTDKEILDPLITLPNSIIRRVEAQTNNKAIMEVARAAVDPKNKVYIGGDVEISKKPQGAFIGYWDKGQHLYLNLGKGAEWIVEDIKLIQTQPFSMIMRAVRSLQGLSKATFTTYNPLFMVSNTAFDAVTSFWTEGVKPWEFVSAWAARIKSIFTDVERVNISRLMGSEQLGFFTKGAEIGGAREVTPFVVKEKGRLRLRNPQSLKRLANPFVLIREVGEAGENAARDVVTQKALKEGLSNDEAGLRGRRVTVDFGRFGTASRQINNWYLYLNAGLQGFLLPGRAVAKNPRSLWRLGLLIAGYIGLTLYNQSYDEYPDVQDSDKVGKLLIMLPSNEYNQYGQKVPHYISLIPMREFATITAPIEYLLGRLMTEDPEAYRTLAQEWGVFYPVVSPISMITETGGLELPTQVASTIQQIITNHDTFRDKPIIDDEMSILPPALQYDKYTNSLAIRIGQAINVSPKRLDFFVSNMFGSMGNEFLRSIDLAIQQIDRELVDERIANLVEQLRAIPTQVPPNQIGVARETFLEGLAIEDRDLVLNMERLPEEKIPFIESAIRRFYRDWGGQVYQTAKEKALANRTLEDYPDKALEELQKAAVLNANNFLKGKVTKQEYDNARTNYRAYYSGASSAEWREAMIEGAVARSEVDKYLPESYQRSEEFQALSAYMEIRQGFIDDAGGILNSDVWDEIEEKTLIELKLHYSDRAIQYAIAHKDDWIDKLPEPARTVERQRAIAIENETWWDDYRGQTSNLPWSGGGDTTTPWGGGTTNNLPWSGYSSK
ncbi:MAG: hypothetical protein MUP81_04450 [Dehalococcoidia bacterium]|nr:hypothetical protein [Dehalococcoidia bacterium]